MDFKQQLAENIANLSHKIRDVDFYGIAVKEYIFDTWQDGTGKLIWVTDVQVDGEVRQLGSRFNLDKVLLDSPDREMWMWCWRRRIIEGIVRWHPDISPKLGDAVKEGDHITCRGDVIGRVDRVDAPSEMWSNGFFSIGLTRKYDIGIDPVPLNHHVINLLNPGHFGRMTEVEQDAVLNSPW